MRAILAAAALLVLGSCDRAGDYRSAIERRNQTLIAETETQLARRACLGGLNRYKRYYRVSAEPGEAAVVEGRLLAADPAHDDPPGVFGEIVNGTSVFEWDDVPQRIIILTYQPGTRTLKIFDLGGPCGPARPPGL